MITAAAAIRVVVFGSFAVEDIREIKLFGFGLALAVLIDATLVSMVLAPATLTSHRWRGRSVVVAVLGVVPALA